MRMALANGAYASTSIPCFWQKLEMSNLVLNGCILKDTCAGQLLLSCKQNSSHVGWGFDSLLSG